MIVYDLICTHEHRFEGWFASADDFARQSEGTLVRCPICDDAVIERRPSVNVQVGRATVPAAEREQAPVKALSPASTTRSEEHLCSCGSPHTTRRARSRFRGGALVRKRRPAHRLTTRG